MTGSIRSKKSKLYMVLSFKDKNGKFRTKWISTGLDAKGNKKKAQQILNEKLEKCKSLEYLDTAQLLFADFIIQWLDLFRSKMCSFGLDTATSEQLRLFTLTASFRIRSIRRIKLPTLCTLTLELDF